MVYGHNYASVDSLYESKISTPQANGRIDLLAGPSPLRLDSYTNSPCGDTSFARDAVFGIVDRTPLSNLFFSTENMEALQQGIRYRVYVESGNKIIIGRQSEEELKIIMRAIFLQNAKFLNTDIVGQVRDLNAKVIGYAVPDVLSGALQYEKYKQDVSTLPVPMQRPTFASAKGSKSLEQVQF